MEKNNLEILRRANDILAGKIHVFESLDPVEMLYSAIDWDKKVKKSQFSFSLYLHSLNTLKYLYEAFKINNKVEYYLAGKEIILSWINYSKTTTRTKTNKYCWIDHSVSLRVENLIEFYKIARKIDFDFSKILRDLIITNCDWLISSKNYSKRHNHGIMQDISLIHASYVVSDIKSVFYHIVALMRLSIQIKYAFPSFNAHSENSAMYYFFTRSILHKLYVFMKEKHNSYSIFLKYVLDKVSDFGKMLIKPNGVQLSIGDTFGVEISEHSTSYVKSQNVKNLDLKLYKFVKDGYCFVENDTKSAVPYKLMFKAGYSSVVHKHYDDMSFTLFYNNQDIFIDPGIINYQYDDEINISMKDVSSHNMFYIEGGNYILTNKSRIKSAQQNNDKIEIIGSNNDYNNAQLTRKIIINNKSIIISDLGLSKEQHNFCQSFHLSPGVTLQEINKKFLLLKLKHGIIVKLEQDQEADEARIFKGEDIIKSYMSIGVNKYIPTETVIYCWKNKNKIEINTNIKIID